MPCARWTIHGPGRTSRGGGRGNRLLRRRWPGTFRPRRRSASAGQQQAQHNARSNAVSPSHRIDSRSNPVPHPRSRMSWRAVSPIIADVVPDQRHMLPGIDNRGVRCGSARPTRPLKSESPGRLPADP
jgi:hypothetical protein